MWLVRNIFFYILNFAVFQFSCANYLNGFETGYSRLVFQIGAALLFLIIILKWRNKWTGIYTLNQNASKYNLVHAMPLSKRFMRWTWLFYGIEILVSLIFPFIYLFFDTLTWPFALVLLIGGIEGVYYMLYNTSKGNFKLAFNENAMVHNARGTVVLPFHNLKSIEYKYDEYFFIYNSGETLTIPEYIVEDKNLPLLHQTLVKKAKEKGIFYSDRLVNSTK
ncbi:MAG TPA: hypothetical protein VD905_08335 [Flavobacteriales bacterium]|nr:hypothetical protein [Flavobacteriales bacterium]